VIAIESWKQLQSVLSRPLFDLSVGIDRALWTIGVFRATPSRFPYAYVGDRWLKAAEILAQLRKWNLYAEQGGAVTPSQGGFLVEVVDLSAQPVLDALTASQRRLGPGRRAIDIYLILEV